MEERKPMYEFDLGFMGKVICSSYTASAIQNLVLIARADAQKNEEINFTTLIERYNEISTKISDALKSVGYYNEVL